MTQNMHPTTPERLAQRQISLEQELRRMAEPPEPALLPKVESLGLRALYTRLKTAEDLLREALASVDADEQDRAASWPDEVEKGELTLNLAERIRAFLEVGQDAGT